MRQARIKVDAGEGEAVYHCMTRTVNGERLLDDVAKEILRKQLWQVADYCGLQIVTYAILSNHFHVLIRVPQRVPLADGEMLRRYGVLYPKPTKFQTVRLEVIKRQLAANGDEAIAWRRQQSALMGDVSSFMKLLKQRFSVWFNRTHQRYGTLWSERFKSVLVEPRGNATRTMAAYIDLNAVRAGLVLDPKDYRFCGYAEAVAGSEPAQRGLGSLDESAGWSTVHPEYRQMLFGEGAAPRSKSLAITQQEFEKIVQQQGRLPLPTILRQRIRHFSDGAVLGSRAFVAERLRAYRLRTNRRVRTEPRSLPNVADWGDLATLRGLRRQAWS